MRFLLRLGFLLIWGLFVTSTAMPQTAPPPRTAVPGKQYCQTGVGFCFRYPTTWAVLGEVFAGNGVVVAPVQKQDRNLWDTITVALVLPTPHSDEDPVSVDRMIEQTMDQLREAGQNVETLQRQERIVATLPAQMIKLRYHEKENDRDWVEEIVFIPGLAREMYSVALRCSPTSVQRLEPALNSLLQSWKPPAPEVAAAAESQDTPKTTAPPNKSPDRAQPQDQVLPKK